MNYESVRLDKNLYKAEGGFSAQLEKLDPGKNYIGTDISGLDAFERQLKRFDIKVSGPHSDSIAKFFATSESAALFPEYVARAVAQGSRDNAIIDEIIASKTEIESMDYRSITTDLRKDNAADTISDTIAEGGDIPETSISLNEHLIKLKKRGRLLSASYEAIRFQRIDVISVALSQIGVNLSKRQLADAVDFLLNGNINVPAAGKVLRTGTALTYNDLLKLWNSFEDFEMNVMLASPDMMMEILSLSEFKDPVSGLNFQTTGSLATPMGAKLIRSSVVPTGKIIGMDKRFALEMVTSGGICVEYDKLINTQMERAAVTSIYGFSKIFPDAVKVLEKQ